MEDEMEEYSKESGAKISLWLRMRLRLMSWGHSFARRSDGTCNRRVADFLDRRVPAAPAPVDGVSTEDVVTDAGTGVWVRIFRPDGTAAAAEGALPVFLHFHGGGFAVLSAGSLMYDTFCRKLSAACRAVVVSVDYRRSPEHRYPVAYDDSFSALLWLRSQGPRHLPSNADLSRCFLIGDSAGGNIVHHVGCRAASQDLAPLHIRGHLLLFPFFGGQGRMPSEERLWDGPIITLGASDWYWKAFLPADADRDHPSCNVFGPNGHDISGLPLPPSLVVIGEYDPLKDWQVMYVRGLRKAGKEVDVLYYKGGVHCFYLFDDEKLNSQFFSDLTSLISRR